MSYIFLAAAWLLHLILCAVLFFLMKKQWLRAPMQLFPIALLVPLFGMVMVFCAERLTRKKKAGTKDLEGIHTFTLDSDDYRRITLFHQTGSEAVVPLEEAMFVNSAKIRRQFMMDAVNESEEDYTPLLQKARLNDDVEVAHYASTAIMELVRKYELAIQRSETVYAENRDEASLDGLLMAYKAYITSGLPEERILDFQRRKYAQALDDKIAGGRAALEYYCNAAENRIALGDFSGAEAILDAAQQRRPNVESLWKIRMKLCRQMGDRQKLLKTIDDMKKSGTFLSVEMRSTLAFWSRP